VVDDGPGWDKGQMHRVELVAVDLILQIRKELLGHVTVKAAIKGCLGQGHWLVQLKAVYNNNIDFFLYRQKEY